MTELFGISAPHVALTAVVVFAAGIVRGYTGFGFSALLVATLGLVQPLTLIVPLTMLLEIAASVFMMREVWKQIDWRWLTRMLVGIVIATPLGVAALRSAPPGVLKVVVSLAILLCCFAIWRNWKPPWSGGGMTQFVTGIVAGVANGAAAIGGLPIIAILLATGIGSATIRATVSALIFLMDVLGIGSFISGVSMLGIGLGVAQDLVFMSTVFLAVAMLVPMLIGVALGSRQFAGTSEAAFKQRTLVLLMVLALIGLVRAAM